MMSTEPRIGSICTGYGGLDEAVQRVFGGTTAWVSDIDPGASKILAHHWPTVPNIGDITTTAWNQIEPVDIVCGGYPCQPFSAAGKRKGTADDRHIWPYIATALRVLRPRIAVFENVANHLRLGFDTVLADLAGLGFDAEWCVVRASDVNAPHQRRRLIVLATAANTAGIGRREGWTEPARIERRSGVAGSGGAAVANTNSNALRQQPVVKSRRSGSPVSGLDGIEWGAYEPAIQRWEHATGRRAPRATCDRNRLAPEFVEWLMGLPAGHVTDVPGLTRNQQLHALGNGVVPQQAEAALRHLAERAGVLPQALAA